MKLKYLIFVLCYSALPGQIRAIGSMGPLGNIIITAVYECGDDEKPKGNEIKFKGTLVNFNDKGDKALDVTIDSKLAIDDKLNYTIDLKKYENGGWKKFYNVKGTPCHDLDRYIKKLWHKMVAHAEPKVAKPCPIPPGSYKLNKFQAVTKDLEIKTIFYGKMLLKAFLTDRNGKMLMCVMGEGDSQAPL